MDAGMKVGKAAVKLKEIDAVDNSNLNVSDQELADLIDSGESEDEQYLKQYTAISGYN
jgi:hypothetical protein